MWNELEKENKEFFKAYSESHSQADRKSESQAHKMIEKIILDQQKSKDSDG